MKNLASCTPSEFLKQACRIRKSVANWLKATDIMNIWKRLPAYEMVPAGAGDEERKEINKRNEERKEAQLRDNFNAILDSVLEGHPGETLEVLALCCFVEPEDVDNYPMRDYLAAINEMLSDKDVADFFYTLMQLANRPS